MLGYIARRIGAAFDQLAVDIDRANVLHCQRAALARTDVDQDAIGRNALWLIRIIILFDVNCHDLFLLGREGRRGSA